MPAQKYKKRPAKPRRRKRTIRNYDAQLWTVPMGVAWSGLAHQHLLKLIAEGKIEAVALGPEQDHVLPNGSTRHRRCAKFLLPSEAFKAFVVGLAARGGLTAA
jgi:hypothetical protein